MHTFKFTGWPIVDSTVLAVESVCELHTYRLTAGMEANQMHLDCGELFGRDVGKVLDRIADPVWCDRLVEVRIDGRYGTVDKMALQVAHIILQTLESCSNLHTLHFSGEPSENHGQAQIQLRRPYSGRLSSLKLKGICCRKIDLVAADYLTDITLNTMDAHRMACTLVLPPSVTSLDFYGHTLFTSKAVSCLRALSSLSKVTLGSSDPFTYFFSESKCNTKASKVGIYACMPILPAMVRHLCVTDSDIALLLDRVASTSLQHCVSLEHLTLPYDYGYPSWGTDFHSWLRAAHHLHVVDKGPDYECMCY